MPHRLFSCIALLLCGHVSLEAQAIRFETQSGAELYRAACVACHGLDGSGQSQSLVGFDTPLPDFTDCGFSTPEPDADWLAVVHAGGPVRAFARTMPAFGEALSEAAILRTLEFVRGFCASRSWPRGELNLPRALVTEKAFPENETVVSVSMARGDAAAIDTDVIYERRLGARNQIELVVPIELRKDATGSWQRALGDAAVAVKHVLFHSLETGTIVSAAAEVRFPATMVEPFVAVGQILPADGFVQLQSGAELPTDGAREVFVRGVIGKSFVEGRFGRTWSPMLEVAAARELADARATEWDIVPQMQITLSRRQHIMVSGGLRIPLTARGERGVQALTYLLWDWFDGGFFDGWK